MGKVDQDSISDALPWTISIELGMVFRFFIIFYKSILTF